MNKTILFILLALLGISQAAAQDYEYVPFVREGVQWKYHYSNISVSGNCTLEIKGDTVVDGKNYKPVHLYSGEAIDEENDTIVTYLREEDKVVYFIMLDDKRYSQCPVGKGGMYPQTGQEYVLYDFRNPADFYGYDDDYCGYMGENYEYYYLYSDTVAVDGCLRKRHVLNNPAIDYHNNLVIEGIGYCGATPGSPLYYCIMLTGSPTEICFYLDQVIENGQVTYNTGDYQYERMEGYVPFVREGVKWVYGCGDEPDRHLLTLELKGDKVIGGKTYKAMHKYSGEAIDEENDTIPVYLREEGKVVYAILPEPRFYDDCPLKLPIEADWSRFIAGEECVLYDFRKGCGELLPNFISSNCRYNHKDSIMLGDVVAKRECFDFNNEPCYIINGVGFDSKSKGYTLGYFCGDTEEASNFFLSHVIEDGRIIYKGVNYQGEPDALPDGYEYVPFVREGVKWVYRYDIPSVSNGSANMDSQYYSFEMKGDVLIGDRYYKPVVLTHYLDKDGNEQEVEDFTPVYLREDGKVVYAIHPNGRLYAQCPVGIGRFVDEQPLGGGQLTTTTEEYVLYDFNDPKGLYQETWWTEYLRTETKTIDDNPVQAHRYKTMYYINPDLLSEYYLNDYIIEGIGYDGIAGMPLFYFTHSLSATGEHINYGLCHVVKDGELIYKGTWYDPEVRIGIDAEKPVPGDINGDGVVTITDVTALINVLLTGRAGDAINDVNGDGVLTIRDVTVLINYLLSHKW